jgi:T4 RnlA family RNA ligase
MFNLDQALEAAGGRDEFVVKRYEGLVSFNYVFQLPDSFDGIRENFRGVTFDESTGEIVSLPLHKFYNVNQRAHTQWHLLKDLRGQVYEKLDGSMVHFFEHRKQLRCSTRMSAHTPHAQNAYKLAEENKLIDLIWEEVKEGYTPIFEYVAPNFPIVIMYSKPRLVYLHSRNRTTGEYRYMDAYPDKAQRFPICFSEIMEHLDKEMFEGYVCVLENGLWVKLKCDWYLKRHGAVDALLKPGYRLYEMVYDGVMDDVIAKAAEAFQPALLKIYKEAQVDFMEEKKRLLALGKDLGEMVLAGVKKPDPFKLRKDYAMYASEDHRADFSLLMKVFENDHDGLDKEIKIRLLEGYKEKYPNQLFMNLEADA